MDNELNPIRRLPPARRSGPIRRLLMALTGLAAVAELFDQAVVELFEDESDPAAA